MFSLFNNDAGLTQKQKVLQILQSKEECVPMDFVRKGILRYGAHIFNLRKEGYKIETKEKFIRDKNNKNIEKVIVTYKLCTTSTHTL